jgi:hypothetical protein
MKLFMILVVACALSNALASASAPPWVVFIRNNEIYTARGDGSGLRQLTSDSKPKQMPKWSPDGTEIAYLTSGAMSADPKSRWKIEAISGDGKHMGTGPILMTMADGTEIVGMRWVDFIGWFGVNQVFAKGHVNPYAGEFRVVDLRSGEMLASFFGALFSTCPARGQVAFWAPTFPPDRRMRLEVNAKDTDRLTLPDSDKLPDIHVQLLWAPGCQEVALVDAEPPAALVLVGAERGVREVPLPNWPFENPTLSLVNGMLLIRSKSKALLFDFRGNTVTEAAPALLEQLDAERAAREKVVHELKGQSPDWWPAP